MEQYLRCYINTTENPNYEKDKYILLAGLIRIHNMGRKGAQFVINDDKGKPSIGNTLKDALKTKELTSLDKGTRNGRGDYVSMVQALYSCF